MEHDRTLASLLGNRLQPRHANFLPVNKSGTRCEDSQNDIAALPLFKEESLRFSARHDHDQANRCDALSLVPATFHPILAPMHVGQILAVRVAANESASLLLSVR